VSKSRPHPAKLLLVERGIQQQQVAHDLGYNRVYVCEVLNGKREAAPAFRDALAKHLRLPESKLFNEVDEVLSVEEAVEQLLADRERQGLTRHVVATGALLAIADLLAEPAAAT
jgi:transcriptional regulator with XRE-family HTH domain